MTKQLDELIKKDLTAQAKELESLVDGGIVDYLKMGFAHNFSVLMKLGYGLAIMLTILIFYCGYQFFTASQSEQIFWGVCLMLSFNAQIATKLWIFMQTNRNILSREIRLMELRLKTNGEQV